MKKIKALSSILIGISISVAAQKFKRVEMYPFNSPNFKGIVIDYNNDGLDDIIGWDFAVPYSAKLFKNNGNGTFLDVSKQMNFPKNLRGGSLSAKDLNKDGLMDLVYNNGDSLIIYLNYGYGFSSPNLNNTAFYVSELFNTSPQNIGLVSFFDYNGDGFYDMIACISTPQGHKIEAIKGSISSTDCGGVIFSRGDVKKLLDFSGAGPVQFSFVDVNNDGYFDLLTGQATNPTTSWMYWAHNYNLYINDGQGSFIRDENSGLNQAAVQAFGTLGDFNNDGRPDILSGAMDCCIGSNKLHVFYSERQGEHFTESTTALDRRHNPYYYTPTIVDINLDRTQDIVWTNIIAIENESLQCFLNNGNNTFTESAGNLGIDYGPSKGNCCPITVRMEATMLDLNNDNKPDLDIHGLDPTGNSTNSYQMINTTPNNGIKLRLVASKGLKEGWGARIRYKTGGTWNYLQHTAYASSNYPFLYLGMGGISQIDSLVVDWVGGASSIKTNIKQGTYLVVEENPFYPFNNSGIIGFNLLQNGKLVSREDAKALIDWFCFL